MFNSEMPIYVTIGLTIEKAKRLEDILRLWVDIYDDNTGLRDILDMAIQIQQIPSILEEHDMITTRDDEDEYIADHIQYPKTNFFQNWKMN